MADRYIAAIDLGASSGRVMLACYQSQTQHLTLQEIHRTKTHTFIKNIYTQT